MNGAAERGSLGQHKEGALDSMPGTMGSSIAAQDKVLTNNRTRLHPAIHSLIRAGRGALSRMRFAAEKSNRMDKDRTVLLPVSGTLDAGEF